MVFCWCCRSGLNTRPPPYQGGALPLSYGSRNNNLAIPSTPTSQHSHSELLNVTAETFGKRGLFGGYHQGAKRSMAGASPASRAVVCIRKRSPGTPTRRLGEQERKLKLGDVPTERRKELQSVTIESLIEWYRQGQDALSAQAQG
jgi:hypothetical protein